MFGPSPFQIWRMFWGELNAPESYPLDWYRALTNQVSHKAVAAIVSAAVCVIYALYWKEMPYRVPVWFALVISYAFWVEYLRQGWRRHDSFNDTYFVGLGLAAPLVSLHEVAYEPEIRLELVGDGMGFIAWLAVASVSLAAHVIPRLVRKWRSEQRGPVP
jgi:hypothetical protein